MSVGYEGLIKVPDAKIRINFAWPYDVMVCSCTLYQFLADELHKVLSLNQYWFTATMEQLKRQQLAVCSNSKRQNSKKIRNALAISIEAVGKQNVKSSEATLDVCETDYESEIACMPSEDKDGNIHRMCMSKARRKSNNPRKLVADDGELTPRFRKSERLRSGSIEWTVRKPNKKNILKSASNVQCMNRKRHKKISTRLSSRKKSKGKGSKVKFVNTAKDIPDDTLCLKEFNKCIEEKSQTSVSEEEEDDDDDDDIIKHGIAHRSNQTKKKIIHKKRPCEVCGRCYNTFYLKVHMRKHTGEKPFCCPECEKHFSTDSLLRTHFQRYHGNTDELQCDICHKVFASKGSLKIHKQIHSEEKPYKCNLCDKEFKQPGVLNEHLKTHSNDFPFQCEVCGKRFKSKRSVFRHKESAHDGIKRTYLCTVCGKVFHDKSSLWRHQKRHEQGYTKHICEVCGKQFHERKVLSTHMLIHEDKKPYQCDVCHKQFRHYSVLKRHQSVHTGIKPFKCDSCGRQFIHRVYMLRHKCLHRGKTGIASNVCGGTSTDTSVAGSSVLVIESNIPPDIVPMPVTSDRSDDQYSVKMLEDSKDPLTPTPVCQQLEFLPLPPPTHENSIPLEPVILHDYEQVKTACKISDEYLQLHQLLEISHLSQPQSQFHTHLQQEIPVSKDMSLVPNYCLPFTDCQKVCTVFPNMNSN